jgi:hypothetical protein
MDFYTREEPIQVRYQSRQQRVISLPQAMGDPVKPDCVQPGIAGHYLKKRAGGWILGIDGLHIFPYQVSPPAQPALSCVGHALSVFAIECL